MPSLDRVILKGVRKRFGRHLALAGINVDLRAGEICLLMGPNGAGKSTLLGIISTLSRPSRGEVLYGELPHAEAESQLRGEIALVAHAPMLYRHLSGRENLRFFAELHGLIRVEEAVTAWLERVSMDHAADRPVAELSRGMIQRLTLARALLPGPSLLLMDEPFTGLDRDGVALLRREISTAAEGGAVVLVVSHDVEAMDVLAGHLLVLRGGRIAVDERAPEMTAARLKEAYHAG